MQSSEIELLAQLAIYLAATLAWKAAGQGQEGLVAYHEVKTLGEKKWRQMADEAERRSA